MRRRRLALVTMLAVTMLAPTGVQAATDVGVGELLADGAAYADQSISVVGELVGDYGYRRDGSAWSQLNGDSYATAPLLEGGALQGSNAGIGVRAPAGLVEDLEPPGGYHQRGPLVRVSGIWKYHDDQRGGETYLDVVSLDVLEAGRPLDETADPAVVATGLLFLLTAAWLGYRSRRNSAA